jgi:hypothetical protein
MPKISIWMGREEGFVVYSLIPKKLLIRLKGLLYGAR